MEKAATKTTTLEALDLFSIEFPETEIDGRIATTKPYVYGPNCCNSSHALRRYDGDNFGRMYTRALDGVTRLFPPLCGGCLLSKFGLLEETAKSIMNNMHCYYGKKTETSSCRGREGPFLRAFKITGDVLDSNVAFSAGTVVLPVGQVLLDTLMTDPRHLFDRDIACVRYRHKGTDYTLNPYLYIYFRRLYEKNSLRSPATNCNVSLPHSSSDAAAIQFGIIETMLHDSVLGVAYQCDAFLFGNLIPPKSGLSTYVTRGRETVLMAGSAVHVDVARTGKTASDQEPVGQESSFYVSTRIVNPTRDVPGANARTIQNMNDVAYKDTLSMNSFVHGRKTGLMKYFMPSLDKATFDVPASAVGLHIVHMCIPSDIVDKDALPVPRKIRSFCHNVEFIEGLGLVTTKEVCHKDFFIVRQCVNIQNYVALKACAVGNLIQYSQKQDTATTKAGKGGDRGPCEMQRRGPIEKQLYLAGL